VGEERRASELDGVEDGVVKGEGGGRPFGSKEKDQGCLSREPDQGEELIMGMPERLDSSVPSPKRGKDDVKWVGRQQLDMRGV
jgi:hypothetical protein